MADDSNQPAGDLQSNARELARPEASRALRGQFMQRHALAVYDRLTDSYARELRLDELVYEAARQYPGLVPTPEQIAAERSLPQSQKQGAELDQGIFLAHLLACPLPGLHLCHVMMRPRPQALELIPAFRQEGHADLGRATVERRDGAGYVTLTNPDHVNAEDDDTTLALELAVDLVLLDPGCEVGVLRGGVVARPPHAGRRVFNAGINLAHLRQGQISFVDFMMAREMGLLAKLQRGHWRGQDWQGDIDDFDEKPWLAAVDTCAVGGGCELLLVVDRVIAEQGAYIHLPARQQGIIAGVASLRLPRFVGPAVARQAILFERAFAAGHPDGAALCDRVVSADEMDHAISEDAGRMTGGGGAGAAVNRRAMRVGGETIDVFRRYMAIYAREQSRCMYAPALIRTLEEYAPAP